MYTVSMAYEKAKYADILRNIEDVDKYRPFFDEIPPSRKKGGLINKAYRSFITSLVLIFKMH